MIKKIEIQQNKTKQVTMYNNKKINYTIFLKIFY